MAAPGDWSPPRIVAPPGPAPVVVGEMAQVRASWRRERRARRGRHVWPALVVLLCLVVVGCTVALGHLLRF